MVEGQAKTFESKAITPPTVAENNEQQTVLMKETVDSKPIKLKTRQIFQFKRQRKIRRKKSSQIV